jgi:hypothetical protein
VSLLWRFGTDLLLHFNSLVTWSGTSLEECFNTWYKHLATLSTLPAYICWFVWQERNTTLFEDQQSSIQRVVHRVTVALQEYKVIPRNIYRKKGHCCHNWSGPTGWFDGAAESSGLNSGAGGIIKLDGQCSYKWLINCGQGTNNRAELLGAWALLTLASRLSIQSIQVQGDSKIIIDWLKEKGRLQVVTLECWKLRIKETNCPLPIYLFYSCL